MAAARVIFVSSDRLASWPCPGLLPTAGGATSSAQWWAWRLVGGNNREIARSARTYPEFHTCFEALSQTQRSIDRAIPIVRVEHDRKLWSWRLEIDGRVEVIGSRLYQRRRDCTANIAQFLKLVGEATADYSASLDTAPAVIRMPDTVAAELCLVDAPSRR